MTELNPVLSDSAPAEGTGPMLSLQAVYLKDASFESPQGPRVDGNYAPQIGLDLQTETSLLEEGLREVVLQVTVTAKQGDKTYFLAEVKQAGAFVMQGLEEEDMKRAVGSLAPGVLFPYARAAISGLVSQGGFPQLLLPPVNFDALYASATTNPGTAPN
jgi:preprotein translocase subunit SecB